MAVDFIAFLLFCINNKLFVFKMQISVYERCFLWLNLSFSV